MGYTSEIYKIFFVVNIIDTLIDISLQKNILQDYLGIE